MEQITYYINLIVATSKNLLASIPKDTAILGLICGFFSFVSFQKTYPSRKASIIQEICSSSKKLSLLTFFIISLYILFSLPTKTMFFYLITSVIGVLIYHILLFIFSYMSTFGIFLNNFLMLISGPITIFVAWFFHSGELLDKINTIMKLIP